MAYSSDNEKYAPPAGRQQASRGRAKAPGANNNMRSQPPAEQGFVGGRSRAAQQQAPVQSNRQQIIPGSAGGSLFDESTGYDSASRRQSPAPAQNSAAPRMEYSRPQPQQPRQQAYRGGQPPPAQRSAASPAYGGRTPSYAVAGGGAVRNKPVRKKKKNTYAIIITLLVLSILGLLVWSVFNVIDTAISGEGTGHGVVNEDYKTLPEWRGQGIVNVLVCGLGYDTDSADHYSDQNNRIGPTDMILYISYDTKANKVNCLQIPRDTFVGDNYKTGGTRKINGVFTNAPDKDNRMNALAEVFSDMFKLPVDYYITLDLDSMKELVEVVSNLNVYVPYDVNDPKNDSLIEKGWRNLNPEQVEFLVRNRYSDNYNQQGDIMRMQTQLNVYSALFRLMKSLTPQDMLGWGQVLLKYVKTNMNTMDILGLLQNAMKIQPENITFIRPPAGHAMYKGQAVISLDSVGTADLLNEYFRPGGQTYTAEELGIIELPRNVGTAPASIRTLASVEEDAPPLPDNFDW